MRNHRTPRGQADQGPPNAILSSPGKRTLARRRQRSRDYLFAVEQPDGCYRLLAEGKWSKFRVPSADELGAMGFPWVAPITARSFVYANRGLTEWLANCEASLRHFSDEELAGYAAGLSWLVASCAIDLRTAGLQNAADELRSRLLPRLRLAADDPINFLVWFSGFGASFEWLPADAPAKVRDLLGYLARRSDHVSVQLTRAGHGHPISLTDDLAAMVERPAPCTATNVDMGVALRNGLIQHQAFQITLSSLLPRMDRAEEDFDLDWNRDVREFFAANVPDMKYVILGFDRDSYPYWPLTAPEHQAFHDWLDAGGKPFAQHCCPGVTGREPTTRWMKNGELYYPGE